MGLRELLGAGPLSREMLEAGLLSREMLEAGPLSREMLEAGPLSREMLEAGLHEWMGLHIESGTAEIPRPGGHFR